MTDTGGDVVEQGGGVGAQLTRMTDRSQLRHVRALLVTEAERNREGREHRDRRVDVAALLDPREVVDAHAGQRGDLLAPEPGGAAAAVVDESDVGRTQRLAASPQERTQIRRFGHRTSVPHPV